jgi:carboxyl-terminal processing protease
MPKRYNYLLPLIFALCIALGMLIGTRLHPGLGSRLTSKDSKFAEVMHLIKNAYVDTVNFSELTDNAIREVINELDPHSYYITPAEFVSVNQDLEGDFDGIGVEFNILDDTVIVVSPIAGGPSEMLGIHAGDRIVQIENKNVAGTGITNEQVIKNLRGKRGTKVNVKILRRGEKNLLDFTITRDKIPINSIDANYMVDKTTGYIKINRFSAKTKDEFIQSINLLNSQGMQDLILDLTGNPGGYLNTAFDIADQFFTSKKLIVYTQGRTRPRKDFNSDGSGSFSKGRLIVLIDEGSASASEIVAGAIQDWDRGIIIGRRSFGKGLVQEQIPLSDGSVVRLTVAKYFTPSGRCIQKPYLPNHNEEYYMDVMKRYERGELTNKDSISFPDSLKFKTSGGRIVYGGGGIMPDIFVPLDTLGNTKFLAEVYRKGLINRFVLDYVDKNRNEIRKRYPNFESFNNHFLVTQEILQSFRVMCSKEAIREPSDKEWILTGKILTTQVKALIARQQFGYNAFYKILNLLNDEYIKAIEILKSGKFKELGIKTVI